MSRQTQCNHKGPYMWKGGGRRERSKEMAACKGPGPTLLALRMEAGANSQRMREASRSWKRLLETDFSLEPLEGMQPC